MKCSPEPSTEKVLSKFARPRRHPLPHWPTLSSWWKRLRNKKHRRKGSWMYFPSITRPSSWDWPEPSFCSHRFFSVRSEEHTSELQSRGHLVCRLLLEQ